MGGSCFPQRRKFAWRERRIVSIAQNGSSPRTVRHILRRDHIDGSPVQNCLSGDPIEEVLVSGFVLLMDFGGVVILFELAPFLSASGKKDRVHATLVSRNQHWL